jgi:hypothetical protein
MRLGMFRCPSRPRTSGGCAGASKKTCGDAEGQKQRDEATHSTRIGGYASGREHACWRWTHGPGEDQRAPSAVVDGITLRVGPNLPSGRPVVTLDT